MATDTMRRPDLKENTPITPRAKSHSPERIDYGNQSSEPEVYSSFWTKPAEHPTTLRDTPKIEAKSGVDGLLVDNKSFYGSVPNTTENKRPGTGLPTRRSISVPSLDKEDPQPQPAFQRSDSDINRLANNLDNLAIERRNTPSPETPMGKMKALNTINSRFNRFNSTNNEHTSQLPTPTRNTSWTATAISPKAKIEEALKIIMEFVIDIDKHATGTDTFQKKKYKLFMDASKEIVRTWHNIHNEAFKSRPYPLILSEASTGIEAIIKKWGEETINEWIIGQSMNLVNLGLKFAREWERLTEKDVGVPKYDKQQSEKDSRKKVESFEKMEFIPPKAVMDKDSEKGAEKNNGGSEPTIDSPDEISNTDTDPSVEDLQPRIRSKSLQYPTAKSTVLPSVEEQPDTPTAVTADASAQTIVNETRAPVKEDAQILERLAKIERILEQVPIKSINEALEMQKLLLPLIYDGIFGEWDKVDPTHHSDKRAQAKRTGLLMLAKYMTEWKDGFKENYGQKIEGLDCAVRGKKSDPSTGLLTTCTRISTSLSTLTTLTTDLTDLTTAQQTPLPPPTPLPLPSTEIPELETENITLHQELDKLSSLLALATEHNAQESLRDENEKLKSEIRGLRKGMDAVLFTLAEKEGKGGDKGWVEEAWEEVYEAFWPQGHERVGVVEAEGSGRKILTLSEELEVEDGEGSEVATAVGNQAGRGGGGGTGTGSCAVM